MNHIYIELEEARRVLAALELAHSRGFVAAQAKLRFHGTVSYCGWIGMKFDGLCDKAHPTDASLNWGCQGTSDYMRVVDGKLVPLEEAITPPARARR